MQSGNHCAHPGRYRANDSPPGGEMSGEPSQASSSSGHRCFTSANVSPSHSPKSHSIRSGSTSIGAGPSAVGDRPPPCGGTATAGT